MKIQYRKKRLNYYLIFGILWLIISLVGLFMVENPLWTYYVFLIISFLYLGLYFHEKKNKYLTIKNGIISVNEPFGKKISLIEIKQIKNFSGDYILKTDKTELTINTQVIDKKSLVKLNKELEKLNLEIN